MVPTTILGCRPAPHNLAFLRQYLACSKRNTKWPMDFSFGENGAATSPICPFPDRYRQCSEEGPEHRYLGHGVVVWIETRVMVIRFVKEMTMWDLLMITATVVFFAVAIAYTHACERLR